MTPDLPTLLACEWEDLLYVAPDPASDFFADGGHSLLAARLFTRLSSALGRDLDPTLVFRHPNFADLLIAIGDATGRPAAEVVGTGNDGSLPLTATQRSVLSKRAARESSGLPASPFTLPLRMLRFTGDTPTAAAVSAALAALVSRQPALRLRFSPTLDSAQIEDRATPGEAELSVVKLAADPGPDAAAATLLPLAEQPFGLDESPRLRAGYLHSPTAAYFGLTLDHLVSDGHSGDLALRQIIDELSGVGRIDNAAENSQNRHALEQFVHQANALEDSPEFVGHLAYWRAALGDQVVPTTALLGAPGFTPNLRAQPLRITEDLGEHGLRSLKQAAANWRVSAFAVLLAATWLATRDLVGTAEAAVTPIANRGQQGLENLIAFCSHAVVRPAPQQLPTVLRTAAAAAMEQLRESAEHECVPTPR